MYIDTHAHLYVREFEDDRNEMIQRAIEQNVNQIVLPNIDLESQDLVFQMAEDYPSICCPCVGLHPCSVRADYIQVLDQLALSLSKPSVKAVGEIGIDLYWDVSFRQQQEDAFRIQIKWAKEHNLPIIIHSRESIELTVAIVEEEQDGNLKGVFHCFSEGLDLINRIRSIGFHMGIGGVTTFKKSQEFRDTLKVAGLDSILLETDAPYLSPVPYRGKRNESSYLPLIADVVARALDISVEEVATVTSKNARALFKL